MIVVWTAIAQQIHALLESLDKGFAFCNAWHPDQMERLSCITSPLTFATVLLRVM